ncbi:MAG TPA: M90 family metallopeptidase [Gemmatimonadales bacterium]|nr:M90 family metallopeptidase [Gemmatimonadales bacterium]
MSLLVTLASVVVLVGGVLAIRPLLLRLSQADARRRGAGPIPDRWLSLLNSDVPVSHHLQPSERVQLLRAARELITTRRWEGCRGVVLTEDMKVVIAAEACLLTMAIPGEPFPGLREILIYPTTFVPRHIGDPRKWLTASEPQRALPELGESWSNGIIVLSLEETARGNANPSDGSNVILHEFAHELAFEHSLTPPSTAALAFGRAWDPQVSDPDRWRKVIQLAYDRICAKVDTQTPSVLHPYAATNIDEFFAVATETFFERSVELRQEDPELYELLCTFYRQNPADANS